MFNDALDILFLGSLFPKEREREILNDSITGIQNASNVLQQGLVSGLDANCSGQVHIINSLHIGSYPKHYKKAIVKTYRFAQTSSGDDINVGFINLKGIKHYSRYMALKPHVRKWALKKTGKKKAMIAYAASATFTKLLLFAKHLNPDIITCLVVADLPEYMSSSQGRSILFKLFVDSENRRIARDIKHIDRFVLVTEQMKDAMQISVPYTVVEGIATDVFESVEDVVTDGIKTILYTGSLTEKYGIIDLVKAFEHLAGDNYRLIICGEGETEEYIRQACVSNPRIIFKGLMRRNEVLELQKSATILINPRPNNEGFTKYSFPSKIMEYMSSGTPVISYKLDGIPQEYFQYMFTIDDEKSGDGFENAIYRKLMDVFAKPSEELSEMGKHARAFVLKEKNDVSQSKKIVSLLFETNAKHT